MWMNRTTIRLLGVFTAKITESFTLREAARASKMHVSLAHRAIQPLIREGIIGKDKHKNLVLNYKNHHETLAFAEYMRRDELLRKERYKDIELLRKEIADKIKEESFVLLLFGSIAESANPRDIDLLLIIDDEKKVEFHERFLERIASGYSLPFEERVISFKSVYEMVAKREEKNIINEILNKHIILEGAELFYRLVQRGRR